MNKTSIFALILILLSSCKEEDLPAVNSLALNESLTMDVQALLLWNDAGIFVEANEVYSIISTGIWNDHTIVTDADGFEDPSLDPFVTLKRDPSGRWFELIASVDSSNTYVIGSSDTLAFNQSGYLSFFANDAEDFYSNNSGSLTTTITRLQ